MSKGTPQFFVKPGNFQGGQTFDVVEREPQDDGTTKERIAYAGFLRKQIAGAVVRMLNENPEITWAEIQQRLSSERRLAI